MLDSETKRRLDSAREILVGKVPDPKSQVEQITIAMIYKFMDDMDSESVALGGKRKFFTREFSKYSWTNVISTKLGGREVLDLYEEGITRMPQNPGVPELFRSIFKNAYLPYKDPETLKSFLKIINEFEYDHSERLGDAFEYLLSVLGAQGDAGQFRTPRHIIDFVVDVMSPKKNEVVLDPACGTAGFLISSYKHILAANVDKQGESTLTPDEKSRIAKNFKGYDIDPNMVRLSLANMYLHGFSAPHIFEYDSLTSEDRWGEVADVVLANPPFMTPKGGIKPHKRFSIQAKKSEVLFVNYIAEHLTLNGRAAIIVPDGIIFQSQSAYKKLRKMLMDSYLISVISLPAGCFNPYSGVKTSILILDKQLSKRCDKILFIKIVNDGTDLAARRKANNDSDLPNALADIRRFRSSIEAKAESSTTEFSTGFLVTKKQISENGEYYLGGDRYKSEEKRGNNDGQRRVCIGDILEMSGKNRAGRLTLPVMSITMKDGLIDQGLKFKKRIASDDISSYKIVYRNELVVGFPIDEAVLGFQTQYDSAAVSPAYGIWKIKETAKGLVDVRYLELVLRSQCAVEVYKSKMQGAVSRRRSIPHNVFKQIEIPLPPLEKQMSIIALKEANIRMKESILENLALIDEQIKSNW